MSSRHVKSFSNIRIDLLRLKLVTFATSHWFRSLLKVWASANTVARKRRPITFTRQRARKERWNTTLIKILKHHKEGKHSSNYIHQEIASRPNKHTTAWEHLITAKKHEISQGNLITKVCSKTRQISWRTFHAATSIQSHQEIGDQNEKDTCQLISEENLVMERQPSLTKPTTITPLSTPFSLILIGRSVAISM